VPFIPHLTWLAKRVVTHRQKMKIPQHLLIIEITFFFSLFFSFLKTFPANLHRNPPKIKTSKSKWFQGFFLRGEKMSIVNSVTDLWIKSQCSAFQKKYKKKVLKVIPKREKKRFLILHWSVILLNSNLKKIASNWNWIK
jgi:hypothetical protein